MTIGAIIYIQASPTHFYLRNVPSTLFDFSSIPRKCFLAYFTPVQNSLGFLPLNVSCLFNTQLNFNAPLFTPTPLIFLSVRFLQLIYLNRSKVCDRGISWSYSLAFWYNIPYYVSIGRLAYTRGVSCLFEQI